MKKIEIYDTTLRDGMQAEGVSFSLEDKLAIAKCLNQLGVDYIEGGYAASNQKEMEFFHQTAKLKLDTKVVAFGNTRRASSKPADDNSLISILACKTAAAALVGKSWSFQVTNVLGCSLDENLKMCADSIEYLKSKGVETIFDAEHFFDGYKDDPAYAMKVLQAVANASAKAIVLCDTNGGSMPDQIFDITQIVCKQFPGITIGIHAHNDSDCATANSLAAIRAGASHIQGTINGLGERCGNANLCTVIPNLSVKQDFNTIGSEKIKTLTEVSRFVFEIANLPPVKNMPYVGESAFAHKAGLHVDAIRKARKSYEHADPASVGNERKFLISELSGKSNILAELEKAHLAEDKNLAKQILEQVQILENQGYQFEAANASFDLLVKKIMGTYKPFFELIKYNTSVEKHADGQSTTEATVKLKVDGVVEHVVGEGDGPVNALDAALRKSLINFYPSIKDMSLIDYKVRVVNAKAGTAAKVRVIISSRDKDSLWSTVGVSENIIEASWLALVDSVEYKLQKDLQ